MKPYDALTEHGQARRLRRLAFHALQHYDLPVARLRLITNAMNGIFRLDTSTGEKWVMRVSLPAGGHSMAHVAAEMDWLAALARETSLSVPRPLAARSGALVVAAGAPGVPEPRLCTIFTWVPGSDLAEHLSAASLAALGELMAILHQHARTYRPPAELDLLRFERVFPFPEAVILFDERFASLFTPQRYAVYQQAIARVQRAIDRLIASGQPMRILHGDLHPWNVRSARGVLSPIDFEDLMWGWPVQDIAASLYYLFDDALYQQYRAAFRQGYERQAAWPEQYPGEIDAFIAARGLGMANFVLHQPNPAWDVEAAQFIERIEQRLLRILSAVQSGFCPPRC
jgi:Ser/Thr protein kinase RdoA (MazF antagonist)